MSFPRARLDRVGGGPLDHVSRMRVTVVMVIIAVLRGGAGDGRQQPARDHRGREG